ncbi:MAG: hypothetical protein KXJ51_07370, partial [Sediminibacterium sp.]|nr:hypothetical protein [Sediminibacterium sp.]
LIGGGGTESPVESNKIHSTVSDKDEEIKDLQAYICPPTLPSFPAFLNDPTNKTRFFPIL